MTALKRIEKYFKGTLDKGLILDPADELTLDCYPDADFAGLWGREDPQDPHCAHSRTGYVITLAGVLSFGKAPCNLIYLYPPWNQSMRH